MGSRTETFFGYLAKGQLFTIFTQIELYDAEVLETREFLMAAMFWLSGKNTGEFVFGLFNCVEHIVVPVCTWIVPLL